MEQITRGGSNRELPRKHKVCQHMAQPANTAASHSGTSPASSFPDQFNLPAPGWLWWALVLALLLPFAYAFGFLFPRGDDFDEVTRAMFPFDLPGGLYEVAREWLTWSGRYTYHFLAVFLGKAGELRPLYGLVCASVVALFGFGLFGLARVAQVGRGAAAFCGVLTVLVVLAGHQCLPNLYMLTDALTMGVLQGMTLVFLWALCRLWHAPAAQALKTRRQAILVGVLTVGVFEHSALAALAACTVAVLLAFVDKLATRETEPDAAQNARTRLRHVCILWIWILGALLVSFLSPGNQVRRATRHIDADVQVRQMAAAFDQWQQVVLGIFDGLLPWAVLLLVLLLRGLRNRGPLRPQAQKARTGWLLAALALAAYLGLSGMLTVVHALSDVTITTAPKLPAGLAIFAAYALGFALWGVLDACPAVERLLARLPRQAVVCLLLVPLLAMLAGSDNWRTTAANAANGSMVQLGLQLQERYNTLSAIGQSAQPQDAPPRFGLLGEIYRPGARKRAIDPSLPQPVVQCSIPDTVFPVQMGETLPAQPETWPNLWVAWMYGLGSVRSAQPVAAAAVTTLLAPAEVAAQKPVQMAISAALRSSGIDAAWLVRANGAPAQDQLATAATFSNLWLILHGQDMAQIKRIAVLRVNKEDWRRLLPVFVQAQAAEILIGQPQLATHAASGQLAGASDRIMAALAGEMLRFEAAGWTDGEYLAVPVCPAVNTPLWLFLGINNGQMVRLDLYNRP